MAVPINIDPTFPNDGDPGGPGGGDIAVPPVVPVTTGTKFALIVAGTSTVFTSDQITAAGGPWPNFRINVKALRNGVFSDPVTFASMSLTIDFVLTTVDDATVEF